jgi:hypothetical protein
MANEGKTNAKYITIEIDDYNNDIQDISAGITNISMPITSDNTDTTGYSDGVINFTMGQPNQPLTMTGNFDTTLLTGAYTVLSRLVGVLATSTTITVKIGIRAAPVADNPEYEGLFFCISLIFGNDLTFVAEFVPATTTAPDWHVVI